MNEKNSLASRLSRTILRYLGPIFTISLVAACFTSVFFTAGDARERVTNSLENTLLSLGRTLERVEASTRTISRYVRMDNFSDEDMLELTKKIVGVDSCVTSCVIAFNPEGENGRKFMAFSYWNPKDDLIYSDDESRILPNYQMLDWFLIPKISGRAEWIDPDFSDEKGNSLMVASFVNPIYDETNRFVGVMRSDIAIDELSSIITAKMSKGGTILYFVAKNGKYFVHPDQEKVNRETIYTSPMLGSKKVQELLNPHIQARERGNLGLLVLAQKPYLATFVPLKTGGMAVMFTPLWQVYKSSTWLFFVLLAIAFVGSRIIATATRLLATRLAQPITEFTYSAANMARGNFNVHIKDVETDDEIKNLHDSLCYMQKSIKRYLQEFRESMASRQMLESELTIARNIQMDMLPVNFPDSEEASLHAFLSPAKEVGGDLYDFDRKEDKLYFCIGDVSGKGVPAALVMAQVKSSLHFLAGLNIKFNQLIGRLNDMVASGNNSEMFITLFIGVIYLKTGEFHYCNAGHNPILIKEAGKPAEYLKAKPNLALGVMSGFPFETQTMMLQPDTHLLIYTDGVTEAETFDKRQFGEDRLLAWANHTSGLGPKEATESLFKEVRSFAAGTPQNDDVTIIAVHYKKQIN